ncbi:hypothetical protein BHE74_00018838 [Ensete ventricosum]|nr:hypothetical protein GW17_00030743 [Ensete ventricosum]RWW73292.1 hypothetical protein BHE74_00018838 [Ensete ventricosum]
MGMLRRRRPLHPRSRRGAGSLLFSFLFVAVFFGLAYLAGAGDSEAANATEPLKQESAKEGSFADMIDRALEKEFPESEQNGGGPYRSELLYSFVPCSYGWFLDACVQMSFQFHDVFNLDNENRAEDIPTLIDRKVITGYLLAGSIIGPGGFRFISEMVQVRCFCFVENYTFLVETVAQFGVIFLLFALGLEFSATKVLKFLMEKNSINALHGQVTVGTLILQLGLSLELGSFAAGVMISTTDLSQHTLEQGKLYLLLLGTTALSLVTTPLLFKLIPAVIHLGVLLRWFTPDSNEVITWFFFFCFVYVGWLDVMYDDDDDDDKLVPYAGRV